MARTLTRRKWSICVLVVLVFPHTGISNKEISVTQTVEEAAVILTCHLSENVKVIQTSWVMGPNRTHLGTFHPQYGVHVPSEYTGMVEILSKPLSSNETSLRLKNREMNETSLFCCVFTTFPSGTLDHCIDISINNSQAPTQEKTIGDEQIFLSHVALLTGGFLTFFILSMLIFLCWRKNFRAKVFNIQNAQLTDPQPESEAQGGSFSQPPSSLGFDPSKLYTKIKQDLYYGRLWKSYQGRPQAWTPGPLSTPRKNMEPGCLGENDGLTFWLAKTEDYDDVMSISEDIYWGNDYLPHRYHEWMVEPDRVVILARRKGKLVALESGLVVDGGHTVVLEGLRVCPSERGHGVAGVIQRFADGYMKKLYPSLKVKRLTRGDDPGPEKLSKFRLLSRRAVLSYTGETEAFDGFISGLKGKIMTNEGAGGSGGRHLTGALETEEQLRAILLDPDIVSRLQLPGGAIIQDWQPLQPIESNLAVLRRRNLSWFVGGSSDRPEFVSFYTPPYPVPFKGGAVRLNVDLFGTDEALAREALVANLEKARAELRGTVMMHVYMHSSLWESLRHFCHTENAGVQQFRERWEQLFLERDL